jgi:hypothetical protein
MMTTRAIDLDRWEHKRDYPLIADRLLAHDNPDWVAAADQRRLLLLPDPARSLDTPHIAHGREGAATA